MKKPNYPKVFTNKFAKKLLTYFGHTDFNDWDDNWCWKEICKKYIQYKDKVLEYLFSFNETHDITNPYHTISIKTTIIFFNNRFSP